LRNWSLPRTETLTIVARQIADLVVSKVREKLYAVDFLRMTHEDSFVAFQRTQERIIQLKQCRKSHYPLLALDHPSTYLHCIRSAVQVAQLCSPAPQSCAALGGR